MRRYIVGSKWGYTYTADWRVDNGSDPHEVGRCRFTVSEPELKARPVSAISALKLKCNEPLSNVAFNFNLRRYNEVKEHTSANLERQW